ncbi:MAG: CRTAC1 family protein, partial [Minisyncoccota bacterium]
DLFVSGFWEPSKLYHNNRDGTFTDVGERMGLLREPSTSAFFVDYDDDRKLDLFVFAAPAADTRLNTQEPIPFAARKMKVYKNLGDSFTDVTADVGLAGYESFGAASASFADYDKNGTLDVVIADNGIRKDLYADKNEALKKSLSDPYIKRSVSVVCGADAQAMMSAQPELRTKVERIMSVQLLRERDGCLFITRRIDVLTDESPKGWAPDAPIIDALLHIPGRARLYKNTGHRFIENTDFAESIHTIVRDGGTLASYESQGEGTHPYSRVSGAFFQPASFDYDKDGRVDIFITSDFGANLLLKNRGGLKFSDVSQESGLDYFGSGMGVAFGDYDNDANADIIVTNSLSDSVFRSNGDGTFTSVSSAARIGETAVGWGVALLDYNLDGLEDVFVANGDNARSTLEPDPQLQRPLLRRDALYKNLGDGRFVDQSGVDMCSDAATGFPLAVSDFDNDGDADVFIGNTPLYGGAPESNVFLENTLSKDGVHYISVRLEGTVSNSQGIGSKVSVTSGDTTQTKFVGLGESFHSQHSATLLFGLGAHDGLVDVRVDWPSGKVTNRKNVDIDRVITISE